MRATKGSIVGRDVYDKRRGLMGRVLKEDGLSLVIEFSTPDGTATKTVTAATFRRWYRVLAKEDIEQGTLESKAIAPLPEDMRGPKGIGEKLCHIFLDAVKEKANQDIQTTGIKDKRCLVIKYNGRNVFEITVCKRRLVVMCHPKSLAPANVARVVKQYPKEFGWPLSAKFVFTDESQAPLMRSIITDGLFYRQITERQGE